MAIVLVNNTFYGVGNSSDTVTIPATTAGNLLVCLSFGFPFPGSSQSWIGPDFVKSDVDGALTQVPYWNLQGGVANNWAFQAVGADGCSVDVSYILTAGGATTISFSSDSSVFGMFIYEVSGVTATVDDFQVVGSGVAVPVVGAALAGAGANDLCLQLLSSFNKSPLAIDSPWTLDANAVGNDGPAYILGASGTQAAPNFTMNGANSPDRYVCVSAAFSAPGGAVPFISNLSPPCGVAGDDITINGTNFGSSQGGSTVTFNGVNASVVSWSSTVIVVTVPMGSVEGDVVVTVSSTPSLGVVFFSPCTAITSVSPTCVGSYGVVTLNGTAFGSVQGTGEVHVGGVNVTVISWSDTQVVVELPIEGNAGPLALVLIADSGRTATYAPGLETCDVSAGQLATATHYVAGQVVTDFGSYGTGFGGDFLSGGKLSFSGGSVTIVTGGNYFVGCGVAEPDLSNTTYGPPSITYALLLNGNPISTGSAGNDILVNRTFVGGDVLTVKVLSGGGSFFRLWASELTDGASAHLGTGSDNTITCNGLFIKEGKTAQPVPSSGALGITLTPAGLLLPADGAIYLIQGTLSAPGAATPCNIDPTMQLSVQFNMDTGSGVGTGAIFAGNIDTGGPRVPVNCPPCSVPFGCPRSAASVPALSSNFSVLARGTKTATSPIFYQGVYFVGSTGSSCASPPDAAGVANILVTVDVTITRLTSPTSCCTSSGSGSPAGCPVTIGTFSYTGPMPTINEGFLLNGFTGTLSFLNGQTVYVLSIDPSAHTFTAEVAGGPLL